MYKPHVNSLWNRRACVHRGSGVMTLDQRGLYHSVLPTDAAYTAPGRSVLQIVILAEQKMNLSLQGLNGRREPQSHGSVCLGT